MSNILSQTQEWVQNIFSSKFPTVTVTSKVDGKTYKVRDMPDKLAAADLLARVRLRLMTLCDRLEQKYPDKSQVQQMKKNFRPDPLRFLEATPEASSTSYSVNKGESIHLCLRQRTGGNESLVPEDTIMFVALHELAHVCTKSIGHTPDFWNNFGWLLQEAEALNLYIKQNFQAHPVSYCGIYITDSPSYDPSKDGTDLSIGGIYKSK